MRKNLFKIGFCTLAALALAAAPAAAIDCQNIPASAGVISPDVLAACGGQGHASRPQLDPTDVAISPEGIGATCNSMVLNNPAATTVLGGIAFQPACDFEDGDFSTLYCVDFANPATLVAMDATNCSATTIGTCSMASGHNPSGMAWDDSTGTMFLSSTDIVTSNLYTIDISTGACTLVGGMGSASPGNIAIGVDTSGQMFGYDIINDSLQSIDKNTGLATTVGPIGFDANFAQGMDFDAADGTCYIFAFNNTTFLGELRTCDTSTGSTTLVGAIGPTGFEEWTGPGIMAGGNVCGLHAQVPRNLRRGEMMPVNLSITHRRPAEVDVPFVLEIRDRRGNVVSATETPSFHLVYGQTVSTSHDILLPSAPGTYRFTVSMAEMRGGTELVNMTIRVR